MKLTASDQASFRVGFRKAVARWNAGDTWGVIRAHYDGDNACDAGAVAAVEELSGCRATAENTCRVYGVPYAELCEEVARGK